jgi:hypothetical protein
MVTLVHDIQPAPLSMHRLRFIPLKYLYPLLLCILVFAQWPLRRNATTQCIYWVTLCPFGYHGFSNQVFALYNVVRFVRERDVGIVVERRYLATTSPDINRCTHHSIVLPQFCLQPSFKQGNVPIENLLDLSPFFEFISHKQAMAAYTSVFNEGGLPRVPCFLNSQKLEQIENSANRSTASRPWNQRSDENNDLTSFPNHIVEEKFMCESYHGFKFVRGRKMADTVSETLFFGLPTPLAFYDDASSNSDPWFINKYTFRMISNDLIVKDWIVRQARAYFDSIGTSFSIAAHLRLGDYPVFCTWISQFFNPNNNPGCGVDVSKSGEYLAHAAGHYSKVTFLIATNGRPSDKEVIARGFKYTNGNYTIDWVNPKLQCSLSPMECDAATILAIQLILSYADSLFITLQSTFSGLAVALRTLHNESKQKSVFPLPALIPGRGELQIW